LSPQRAAKIALCCPKGGNSTRAYLVSKALAALLILLSIAALAGLLLSLAIVGLHIQEDLRNRHENMGRDLPIAAHERSNNEQQPISLKWLSDLSCAGCRSRSIARSGVAVPGRSV
jgi:hypothetical protein